MFAPTDVITGYNEYGARIISPEPGHGSQVEAGRKEFVAIPLAPEPLGCDQGFLS